MHSSFKPILDPDFIIPVEIEGRIVDVYVLKRPLMDEFLTAVGQMYEVVVFTASLSKYADPLLDLLDPENVIRYSLSRYKVTLFSRSSGKALYACKYLSLNEIKCLSITPPLPSF